MKARIRQIAFALIGAVGVAAALDAQSTPAQNAPAAAPAYSVSTIEGWTMHVRTDLLADEKPAVERALVIVQQQLRDVVRVVPAAAVAHLRQVHLWMSPEYPGVRPTAEYHPNVGWLRQHGRDPAMAKGIEFTNIRILEQEAKRMPVLVLHELSHAYHERVLGFDRDEIRSAYEHAKLSKTYDAVERRFGDARPNITERAYAMANAQEYFAEASEAFFGQNDYFPFTRAELKTHDPQVFALLERLWNLPAEPVSLALR